MQEEKELTKEIKPYSYLRDIISKFVYVLIVSCTVFLSILVLIFNSKIDDYYSVKLKYIIVMIVVMISIVSTLAIKSYEYHRKNLELMSAHTQFVQHTNINPDILKFYGKFIGEPCCIVYPPMEVDPPEKGTQVNDFEGIMELQKFFLNNFRKDLLTVKSDAMSEKEKRQNNLICIGGPMVNEITAELLLKDEIVYRFDGHNKIVDKLSNQTMYVCDYDPHIMDNNYPSNDFGIITRMKNPYNLEMDAIISCGCFGWGTKACINVLRSEEHIKQLTKYRYFQALCSCDIDRKGVINRENVEMTHLRPINY